MCGIVGYWDKQGAEIAVVEQMAEKISHRGPDGAGVWLSDTGDLAMAHRRLAIIDLSPAGHQPMTSPCGRFTIVFNGEIYNHIDLRKALEDEGGHFDWRGHSDTETLLAALRHWGVEATLQRLNGMFAFVLWDARERNLFLARDRMGEKPLYYGWMNGSFIFGSELKAIKAFPGFSNPIDRDSITLYLRYNYIPAPFSIYKDICKLRPGHVLTFNIKSEPRITCYWSALDVVKKASDRPFHGSEKEAIEELDILLRDSIKLRMISDVPLGAFLSGGIDSSCVISLMQAQSSQPIKTFTIGFHETRYNEAKDAKRVAKHLGTDHTELYVTPKEAIDVIPKLPEIYDEPFSDSSQIPTFLISQLTRQYVTVSLSGDGGDELFGGYNRHQWAPRIWKQFGWLPIWVKKMLAFGLTTISPDKWDGIFYLIDDISKGKIAFRMPGYKIHKMAELLPSCSAKEMYEKLTAHWFDPNDIVKDISSNRSDCGEKDEQVIKKLGISFSESMMLLDTIAYLPDDILTKVDRASMAVSLEARVPLIDHRVFEFAWRLPLFMKIRNGIGKWILRQVLYKYIPKKLVERPKAGFGVPLDAWLRGPLKEWVEELLDKKRLQEEGFFHAKPIRKKWQEHLSGKRNWAYHLWDVLMFQAWLEKEGKG